MSMEFLVANEEELQSLSEFEKLVELIFAYDLSATGANDFKAVRTLSNFFLKNENYIPTKGNKDLRFQLENQPCLFRFYKFDKKFIKGVASFDKAKLDDDEAIKFWQSQGYFSQAIWNAMFGLHNLCIFALRDNKNVYLMEEINESNLEK